MKIIARIHGLTSLIEGGISSDFLEKLCSIYPEGRCGGRGHAFFSDLPLEDPRTKALLRLLESSGKRPWISPNERDKSRDYFFELLRVYDDSDLEACEYLELVPPFPQACAKGLYRTNRQRGRIIIERPPPEPISYVYKQTWVIVRDDVRQMLESAGLRHLVFRSTKRKYESFDYNLYDEEDIWWELRSELVLPSLAPSMTLVHKDFTPFTGDFSKGCMRQEGWYVHPELHYRAEDLAKVEPFDLAHTHEMFGGRIDEYNRPLVASQRFYQVCREHGVETGWAPVRIDA